MFRDLFKDNGQKALIAITIAVVVFVSIAAGFGDNSQPAGAVDQQVIQQAAVEYFERMPDHINKIKEAELKQLVDSHDSSIYLIDIREEKDYVAGHIEGAHNIPFREIGRELKELPQDKTLVVYCYTGQTAGQTVSVLNMAGYQTRALNGGMNNGWLAQNYPIVK